jgi:hypothetical protein
MVTATVQAYIDVTSRVGGGGNGSGRVDEDDGGDSEGEGAADEDGNQLTPGASPPQRLQTLLSCA